MQSKVLLFFVLVFCQIPTSFCWGVSSFDTIPDCSPQYIYDMSNFKMTLYERNETIDKVADLGFFNWGTGSSNFVIIKNKFYDDKLTFLAFDDDDYLVYSEPFKTGDWFNSISTGIKQKGYQTLSSNGDVTYVYQSGSLYKYRLGGELIRLRSDLNSGPSQQAVDEYGNFIYLNRSALWICDAVHVVDSSGVIRYRFEFEEEFNNYGVSSIFLQNDSLFAISSGFSSYFENALLHIKLDYENYTAKPEVLYNSNSFYSASHYHPCSPGEFVSNCTPNIRIEVTSLKEEDDLFSELAIYPNPSHDFLFVQNLPPTNSLSYEIVRIDSKAELKGVLNPLVQAIDINSLLPGIYTITFYLQDDSRRFTSKRFIKI